MRYGILALVTSAQAGAAIVQQGMGSLGPFFTSEFSLNRAQLGVIFGVLMVGGTATTLASGVAVDAFGERRMILFSGVTMGIALIVSTFVHSYVWLVVWMMFAGVGYAAATPAGGRAILLWFERNRGLAMGVRQMGVPIGGFIGALLLPLLAAAGTYRLALVVGGILTMLPSIAATVLYRHPEGHVHVVKRLNEVVRATLEVARDRRIVYVTLTCMILVTAQSNMLTFFVLTLVRDAKIDIAVAGAGLALAQVGATAGRLAWGFISDSVFHGDRMVPLMCSCVLASIASASVAFLPEHAVAYALGISFVLGISGAGWNGLFTAAEVEIGGPDRAGSALGIGLTGVFAMGIVAPPLFGVLADARGFPVAWLAQAGFILLAFMPALLARRAIGRARLPA
jgi:ACS family hexuronate transporter-like MFS transporter